jgi:hypothetical protein
MMGAREISALHESKRHGDQGHHQGYGIKNWFKRGQLPLFSSVWEKKLLYSSASDIMAVEHNTTSANTKNAVKAAAPAPLAVVAVSTKSLKLLGTSHLSEDL